MSAPRFTLHLIANAHLDPVWLWDWREGLNEGLSTCRTICDLMDEDPALTFIRGEAAVYRHLARHDPATFARIKAFVAAGRWDVVGGNWIQPDTNLPATEALLRQFLLGRDYFRKTFGVNVRAAWAADSFGHSAGLAEILTTAGFEYFAFTRPFPKDLPLPKATFWWEAASGKRLLCHRPAVGWYGAERAEMPLRLDALLAAAEQDGFHHVPCFYGVGNHGGGPTRRHLADIRTWARRHPDIAVVHSGLHQCFDALRAELARHPAGFAPVHRGELNFCLRGCYASVAKFKFAYRRAENLLVRAERTDALIAAAQNRTAADLTSDWEGLLFNAFHDILPGSSIARAYEDQLAWIGGIHHAAQLAEADALLALARTIDTTVAPPVGDAPSAVPVLLWNPHPQAYHGHVELEAALDYRPIWRYENRDAEVPVAVRDARGRLCRFQTVAPEHRAFVNLPSRRRVVLPVRLPAFGWQVYTIAYDETLRSRPVPPPPIRRGTSAITLGDWNIRVRRGARGVQIRWRGRSLLGRPGLNFVTVEDPWGSWGGMSEEPGACDLSVVREHWVVTRVEVLEQGPERSTLAVRFNAGASQLDLLFRVHRGSDAIEVQARLLWNERSARLKLVLPAGERAEFEVPGGRVLRGPAGEVPGGRWVRVFDRRGRPSLGFASDALYGFDTRDGALRATIARASRYAADAMSGADDAPWEPAVDRGELTFRFALTPGSANLHRLAAVLEQPPVATLVPARPAAGPRQGTLAALHPATLHLLAIHAAPAGSGWILRVQETSGRATAGKLTWLGQPLSLPKVPAHAIASFQLRRQRDRWCITPWEPSCPPPSANLPYAT